MGRSASRRSATGASRTAGVRPGGDGRRTAAGPV